jgi:hypothetical protein
MLTGVKPFGAPDVTGILRNVVEKDPPLTSFVNSTVPEPLAQFVARLLAKAPDVRPDSTAALEDMQKLRSGLPVTVAPPPHPDEATTPLPRQMGAATIEAITPTPIELSSLDTTQQTKTVRPATFWGVVALLLVPLIGWGISIQRATDARPTGVITDAQLVEASTKRHLLADARNFAQLGRFDEALQSYDKLIARYPDMAVAKDERAQTAKLLEDAKPKATVTARAQKPKAKEQTSPAKPAEEEKKPSFWQRIFRRGNKKPATTTTAPPK